MNVMTIDGFQATICFVPDMQMFRGEFINLSGGADFFGCLQTQRYFTA